MRRRYAGGELRRSGDSDNENVRTTERDVGRGCLAFDDASAPGRAFIRKVKIARDKYPTGKGELERKRGATNPNMVVAGNKSTWHRRCVHKP